MTTPDQDELQLQDESDMAWIQAWKKALKKMCVCATK